MSEFPQEDYIPKTFEDLACYWFLVHGQNHKSPSSLKRDQGIIRNYILPAFGEKALGSFRTRDVEQWFANLHNKKLSPKSCNDMLGLFKKILNDGERWEFISQNPANRVKKKSLVQRDFDFWTLEEIQKYIGFWKSEPKQPRIYYCVVLALYTGMRRGELAGLRWDAVDRANGFIHVRDSYCRVSKQMRGTTKSKKTRRVPINTLLASFLDELKKLTGKSDYVLPFFNLDLYHREFKISLQPIGLREIRFHDLRHTFASHFLMGGGNIYDLKKIMGHSTVQVTELYAHLVPEHLKGKTEVLGF